MTRTKKNKTNLGSILKQVGITVGDIVTGGNVSKVLGAITGSTTLTPDHKEQLVKELQLVLSDIDSARDMNTEVQKSVNSSLLSKNIVPLLAIGVLLLFMFVQVAPMFGIITITDVALNGITNVLMVVVSFYFGSSVKGNDV